MSGIAALTDPGYNTPAPTEIEDELARYVRSEFIEAEHYRRISGVEERLLQALRMRRYQYDPQDRGLIGGIDIYIGLGALKSRAAASWINDILLNSIDKPWTIKPTPIPELPEWLKEQVVDALEVELEQMGIPPDIRQRAKQLKDAALKFAQDKATECAASMETKIEDQLLEGEWRTIFGTFIDDFSTFPLAAIRTPVIQKRRVLEWDGNAMSEAEKLIYTSRRISPFDCYPSLDSTTPQDGRFWIERLQIQPSTLYMFIGIEGFSDQAIREVIDKYGETGFEEQLRPDYQRKYLEDKYLPANNRKTIDVLILNGKIQGKMLLQHNILVPDSQAYYETEVWTVNNQTIRAILNPYPLQIRPIYCTSFVKVPGSLWGEGLLDILRDLQRMANSCGRSVVRNLGYASGPMVEVDVDRLADGEKPDEIIPYKVYHVQPDTMGHGQPAFVYNSCTFVANQIQDVMDRYWKMADDISGIPAYVLGNPQVSGAGRTLGGLAMMMGNAAKGIKNCILNIDRDVIEPAISLYYKLNMLTSDDPDIKADAQVVARGATGLLQREMAQSRMVELLQTYMPYVQMGLITAQGAQIMIRESMKNTGMPVDKIIPDPMGDPTLGTALGRVGLPPQMQAMNSGTSTPVPLDGRSATPPMPGQPIPSSSPGMGNPTPPSPMMPTNLPQGA